MTTTTSLKTWGEIADYTWANCWKTQVSARDTRTKIDLITKISWGPSFPLKQLSKGHTWIELRNDIAEEGEKSNATINKYLSCASHALKFTYDLDLHSYRCPNLKQVRLDESKTSVRQAHYNREQVEKIAFIAVDIYERQALADAIIFSAYTGLRQGELLKIKVGDVDLESMVIHLGGRPDNRTKNGKPRAVPIKDKLLPIIERQTKDRTAEDLLFGDDFLNGGQLYKQFKKCRRLAGIDGTHVWHSFRHSFATWSGAVDHPRTLMEVMGHKHIDTTLKYCKPVEAAGHAMVAKL